MTVNAKKASAFASALATGINSLAFISDADALSRRLRARAATRWRSDVLSAIVDLERACELLGRSKPPREIDEARSLISELIGLLKMKRWDPIKISATSSTCMAEFEKILGLKVG